MYALSEYFEKGIVVDQDLHKAFELCFEAAKMNNADAALEVACCYYVGKGIDKNISEASKWCDIADELGNDKAYILRERIDKLLKEE
ncbi:MAG: hypothetical protein LUG46_08220 [Erysipelotrichaceae bacterium]|nr:hypothetical protein [Erysipelotrichaceae bacterium]